MLRPTNGDFKQSGKAQIGDGMLDVVDSCRRSKVASI